MKNPDNLVFDGFDELAGVDGSNRPIAIAKDKVSRSVNRTFRGRSNLPRPGYTYRKLTFEDDAFRDSMHGGRFQAAMVYEDKRSVILVMKGGRLWRIDPAENFLVTDVSARGYSDTTSNFTAPAVLATATLVVADTTNFSKGATIRIGSATYTIIEVLTGTQLRVRNINDIPGNVTLAGTSIFYYDTNPSKPYKAWCVRADKWAVFQDSISLPLIFDGTRSRRAGLGEIKTGRAMGYGRGRIWIAGADGRSFFAGDILNGASGTPAENYRDAILKMEENSYLAENHTFGVPASMGQVQAMIFPPDLDTSLGQGPLQVFCENGVFSCNTPEGSDWQALGGSGSSPDGTTPIRTQSLFSGASGDQNTIVINKGDIFFRTKDGISSFSLARDAQKTGWSTTPISGEMEWVLNLDNRALLEYGSAVEFDNRFISTCAPFVSNRGVLHKGLVVLDLKPEDTIASKRPAQWEGMWEGVYAYAIVSGKFNGVDRCFLLSENENGEFEIFEITRDQRWDITSAESPSLIRSWIEFSSLSYPTQTSNGRDNLKRLSSGEISISEMIGSTWFRLRWRPDGYPCWSVWATWRDCAGDCNLPAEGQCMDVGALSPQYRPIAGIPQPPDTFDNVTNWPLRAFYAVQVRLDMQGYCNISKLSIGAELMEQPITAKMVDVEVFTPEVVPEPVISEEVFVMAIAAEGEGAPVYYPVSIAVENGFATLSIGQESASPDTAANRIILISEIGNFELKTVVDGSVEPPFVTYSFEPSTEVGVPYVLINTSAGNYALSCSIDGSGNPFASIDQTPL